MMKRKLAFLLSLIIPISYVIGQDVQFSQYYASATYLNPAFAAVQNNFKFGGQYRNQWKGIGTPFTAYFGHAEHLFDKKNVGVGISFLNSNEGNAGLNNTEVNATFAYKIKINDKIYITPAVQGGIINRSINQEALTWNDQITKDGFTNHTDEVLVADNLIVPDFGTGILFVHSDFFIGASAYHLAEPNVSFFNGADKRYRKLTLHGGYRIPLTDGPKDKSILINTLFKSQGTADQLDAGLYLNLEPIVLGAWYRGIPINQYLDLKNHESMVFLAGMLIKKFSMAYSYDWVISDLNAATVPVHEISFSYEFKINYPSMDPKMGLPIPLF